MSGSRKLRVVRSGSKPNRLWVYDDCQLIGKIEEHPAYVAFTHDGGYARTVDEAVAALETMHEAVRSLDVSVGFPDWTLPTATRSDS